MEFQWHNREFYKNGDQCGKKKTIFPNIMGKKSMQWEDIIRGKRKPMDRGLKYPYMVCICLW